MEIFITIIIVLLSIYFLYKGIKRKSKGCTSCEGCNHNNCSSKDNNIKFKQ